MRRAIITGDGYSAEHFLYLQEKDIEYFHIDAVADKKIQLNLLPTVDFYLLGGDEILSRYELELATNLKIISFVGSGHRSFIDIDSAEKLNIKIRNTPNLATNAVVEHTVGMLLGIRHHLFILNELRGTQSVTPVLANELASAKVGIHGMGNLGRAIGRVLKNAFNCEVRYHSRTQYEDIEFTYMSKNELLAWSDVTILMLPTTPTTTAYLGEPEFLIHKKGSILLNTAGARLVDPIALRKALESGSLAAAGFDGYFIEPPPTVTEDPYNLLTLPSSSFVMTPHTAAKTKEAWSRMVNQAVKNLIE